MTQGGIVADCYNYCIAITGTPTKGPTTTTKAAPPGPTVSLIQEGVCAKCNKWYLVTSGNYRQKIVDQFTISLSTTPIPRGRDSILASTPFMFPDPSGKSPSPIKEL
ncbi:hypothetical protein BKA65DRAFT_484670 [Rhexocercosporidium sp. MPI-PUGE-AT-0058]|nr:hypothetical protein BKA65DRAFT_484670 [Rhexocercosporidium sp. MPI-PUGE-AT-0058]